MEKAAALSRTKEEKMLPFLSSAKVSSMSIDDVERDFQSRLSSGLSNSDAERRRRIYGSNEFDVGPDTPLWRKYVDQVLSYYEQRIRLSEL